MAHQYMPKIFHDPHKNPPSPSYILNARSLNDAHGDALFGAKECIK